MRPPELADVPAAARAAFEGHHVGPALAGRYRSGCAGDAESHHDHVGRLVEANLVYFKRRDWFHPPPRVGQPR